VIGSGVGGIGVGEGISVGTSMFEVDGSWVGLAVLGAAGCGTAGLHAEIQITMSKKIPITLTVVDNRVNINPPDPN
jgi:hypothetical protein